MVTENSIKTYKRGFMDLTTWKRTNLGYTRSFRGVTLMLYRRDGRLARNPMLLRTKMDKGVQSEFFANIMDNKYLLYANIQSNTKFYENYKHYCCLNNKEPKNFLFLTSYSLEVVLQDIFKIGYSIDIDNLKGVSS